MAQLLALFWVTIGQWLESRGMGAVAEDCYRLAGNKGGKRGAKALCRLGGIMFTNGQLQDALAAYQESIHHDPANVSAWCDLGVAYRESAEFDEARRCYDRALEIDPLNSLALTRMGELHLAEGNPGAALNYFERVADESPVFHEALVNRIEELIEGDKLVEAEHAARQAIERYPDNAHFHACLGSVLIRAGKARLGLAACKKALEIQPEHQEALFNLTILQNDVTALQNNIGFIRQKLEQNVESAYLQILLAKVLRHSEQLAEAEAVCRKLLENQPTHAPGWKALAECVGARGDAAQSLEYCKKALVLQPEWDVVFSSIVFSSTYLPDQSPETIFKTHLDWAGRYEAPLLGKQFKHLPGKDADKRLKIGYVSGDLRNHPVGILLRGALQQHDHGKFEIHCFQTSFTADHLTEILRAGSDYWHQAQLMSVDELANLIHAQGIDILVDLSGHSFFNRLKVFALKPAPIQAAWIGYFHSTGLSSIDYFITDPHTTPQASEQYFSEIPARLPHSRFCYTPFELTPEVSAPPFSRTGYITFGSFNRLSKLNEPVIDAWSRIVMSLPAARLLIKSSGLGDTETAERLKQRFEACGLSPERLILRPSSNYLQMFDEYSEVDIALDPFPFNGGMTTLDALWMGVPVVTLAGNSVVSRQSVSILTNLGLDDLVFPDVESYVAGAVALALDTPRITNLRGIIRPKMSRSPLCDAEQFTQDLEMLYRRMWQAWCRGEKLGPEIVPGAPVARKIPSRFSFSQASDRPLLELFQQKRWQGTPPLVSLDPRLDALGPAPDRIEVVSATRMTESEFWNKSALGISLRRLGRDTRLVANIAYENQRGLPEVYNTRINAPDSQEILVFIHDDVWIDDCFLADHVINGLAMYDVIGVAGNRRRVQDQPAWGALSLNNNTFQDSTNKSGRVAHDSHPFGAISFFGPVPAECELLDGLFLATKKSRLKSVKVEFDPRFDFHFYDMDFCRSARKNGLRLGTWMIGLTHQSHGAFGSPQWNEKHRLYQDKWEADQKVPQGGK